MVGVNRLAWAASSRTPAGARRPGSRRTAAAFAERHPRVDRGGAAEHVAVQDLLPIDGDVAVGHHVGFTPLIRAKNLADELGCREVWVKNDSVCHPSWSFKDRVVSVAVTKAASSASTPSRAPPPATWRTPWRPRRRGPAQVVHLHPGDLEQGQDSSRRSCYNRRWWRYTAPTTR